MSRRSRTGKPPTFTVIPEWVAAFAVHEIEEVGRIVGHYGLLGAPPGISLDKPFADANWIGTGRGKQLWLYAVATARTLGAKGAE
jgi:hypothetical protein